LDLNEVDKDKERIVITQTNIPYDGNISKQLIIGSINDENIGI
jgi:hypothetical protein